MVTDHQISLILLEKLKNRGPGKTICPSEVARSISSVEAEWRSLMLQVRTVAGKLAEAGELSITQRGIEVDIKTAKGPVRLGLPK